MHRMNLGAHWQVASLPMILSLLCTLLFYFSLYSVSLQPSFVATSFLGTFYWTFPETIVLQDE